MAYRSRLRSFRLLIPITILVMILVRLVWIQLRTYPVDLQPRAIIAYNHLLESVDSSCYVDNLDCTLAGYQESVVLADEQFQPEEALKKKVDRSAFGWFMSPGYLLASWFFCAQDYLNANFLVKFNQWTIVTTAFLAGLMVRFLSGSWVISLIAVTVLLSRGRLLADIGVVGNEVFLVFTVTAWAACKAHYLRTGSVASFTASVGLVLFGALFDRAILVLALAMPCMVMCGLPFRGKLRKPVLVRLRSINRKMRDYAQQNPALQDENDGFFSKFAGTVRAMAGMRFSGEGEVSQWRPRYESGGTLRSINMPFVLWVFSRRHWRYIVIGSAISLFVCFLIIFGIGAWAAKSTGGVGIFELAGSASYFTPNLTLHWLYLWTSYLIGAIDLHLGLSLVVIVICALHSPAIGFMSFMEACWFVLFALFFLLFGAFAVDFFNAAILAQVGSVEKSEIMMWTLNSERIVHWVEPLILSLGVVGVFDLLKVLGGSMSERT